LRDYRSLKVWAKAHRLNLDVYALTNAFPREEVYGLTSQMRRAASSIPTNLAEGCGRETVAELARFLYIAMGSVSELDCQLLMAKDLDYITLAEYEQTLTQLNEVRRMLIAYLSKIKQERQATR
jgi:four helix bundle protein